MSPSFYRLRLISSILIITFLFGGCSRLNNKDAAIERPNLILILTDDLDQRLGTLDYMPNLKKLLVAEGLSFNNFYVSTPLCCPSRATILRGQYVHNHHIYTNAAPTGGFEVFRNSGIESSTLASWLQEAGYRTVILGKYLNGFPSKEDHFYTPPGWSEWYLPVRGKPYAGRDYQLNDNGEKVNFGDQEKDYLTDVLAQRAADFIRRASKESAPFFIYFSTYAPHEPARPAPRHNNLFNEVRAPQPPSFNEQDVSDKPGGIQGDPLLTAEEIIEINERYITRLRSMQAVDEMIATLVKTLERTKELDNTFIVFTSDNGFHLGQHRLKKGKATPYLEDIQVPFIVRGPGVPRGEILDGYLAGNIDLAPTFAELAGIEAPDFVDGRSLVPLFSANSPPTSSWRQVLLLEQFSPLSTEENESEVQNPVTIPSDGFTVETLEISTTGFTQYEGVEAVFLGLITPTIKYIEYAGGFRELYDLKNDPYELDNLAAQTDAVTLEEFSTLLAEIKYCAAANCRMLDKVNLPTTTNQ